MNTANQDITTIIDNTILKLKSGEFYCEDVPDELKYQKEILCCERELGLRSIKEVGYDIINNSFYVVEHIFFSKYLDYEHTSFFHSFNNFYNFVNGDIYINNCYYMYSFSPELISEYKIDISRINFNLPKSYITEDDYTKKEELKNERFALRKLIQESQSYEAFKKNVIDALLYEQEKTPGFYSYPNLEFYLYAMIEVDKNRAYKYLIQIFQEQNFCSYYWIQGLCCIYDPNKLVQDLVFSFGSRSTISSHKSHYKSFVNSYLTPEYKIRIKKGFDSNNHFYYIKQIGYDPNNGFSNDLYCMYFDSFEAFADYLNNDLSDCDLFYARLDDVDFSKYIIDDATILPRNKTNLNHKIQKWYDKNNEHFCVKNIWTDDNGIIRMTDYKTFNIFSHFLEYVNNDLSWADLFFCDGLSNIKDFGKIVLNNTILPDCCKSTEKINFPTKLNSLDYIQFPILTKNEDINPITKGIDRRGRHDSPFYVDFGYISDIHLEHRIKNAHCNSFHDVISVIKNIVKSLNEVDYYTLLIAGDTASDFNLFKLFISELNNPANESSDYHHKYIFVLGNHEFWQFKGQPVEDIYKAYKNLMSNDIIILCNDIFYANNNGSHIISFNEASEMSDEELQNKTRNARYVILGGVGFAGSNSSFNANDGIYRNTISREKEIEESKKFYDLYKRTRINTQHTNLVVLTHNPISDWSNNIEYDSNIRFVNGHTHRNFCYNDGMLRIYADNQVGYKGTKICVNRFGFTERFNYFEYCPDGIHEISRQDYQAFFHGINQSLTFSRDINKLFLLKKNGYYMFIHQMESGKLQLLEGGHVAKLCHTDLNYYFENMDIVTRKIKKPLSKFTKYQKEIASAIKDIGGDGFVHGCIIDIDYYNHIFVNPFDGSILPYYATDVTNRITYPSIDTLLKEKRPSLYENYIKSLNNTNNAIVLKNNELTPSINIEQYMYTISYKIKKMQKIEKRIITVWDDSLISKEKTLPN